MSIISQDEKEKLGQDFKHGEISVGPAYPGAQRPGASREAGHATTVSDVTPSTRLEAALHLGGA